MWTIVNDFHIEKTRLPVIVVTDRGERLTGDLFVVSNARTPSGHEEVPDVLNSPEPFFPLATLSGRTLLCAKAHIREVVVPTEDVPEPDWALGARADVAVTVTDGELYSGTLFIEQATANQRVLDYLNKIPARFVQLYTAQGVILINRDAIVHVEHLA